MIENLSKEQIESMFNALPFQMLFIDENDLIQFWNDSPARLTQAPSEDIVGKDVRDCHKEESLPMLEKFISDLKSGKADEAEFWVGIEGTEFKALNRFFAIRDKEGKYLGMMEYLLNFSYLDVIAEQKKDAYTYRQPAE
jgi:PAS domain S-box-containing protein